MTASLKKKADRNENDRYETPKWAVEALLRLIPINPQWTYLEPCRASGRFYEHMPEGSLWAEISEGVDYLKTDFPKVNCVLTNPPYSLAQEFVEKAHTESGVIIMLLRLGFLESMKRVEFWKKYPVDHLVVLSRRPSFTDNGKTDGAGYAYFIWDKMGRLELDNAVYWISDLEKENDCS